MRTEVFNNSSYSTETKKRSDLSVELVYITPAVARNYLNYNTKNRTKSERNIKFLVNQMKNNLFLENGESIVFDIFNNLTDGQHRLEAIIKSGKSYYIPVVRGVSFNSIATYDTGKNRSAADVLALNGFKNTNVLSSTIKFINKYSYRGSKAASNTGYNRSEALTNQQILDYCQDNFYWLNDLVSNISSIYYKSKFKFLGVPSFCLITYIIGGKSPSKEVYDFIKNIYGLSKEEDTATSYLYTKLYNAKINKEPLNFYWILGMSIKAWNYYSDGNPSIKYFKFSTDLKLPKINKH
tara:strand:+ start:1215 stop:2099 length:885 start_codon:yes stop_codon:yes gene_type:complete